MFEDVRMHLNLNHVFLATENLSTPFFKKDYIMVILDFLFFYSNILQKNTCLHSNINLKHLKVTHKLKIFDESNTFEPK